MKILHLNSSEMIGGAARAANRLHHGLLDIDVDSYMLVGRKSSDDPTVIAKNTKIRKFYNTYIRGEVDRLPLKFYGNRVEMPWAVQYMPDFLERKVASLSVDIINIHWICGGFLRIETLSKFKQPLVWMLHDMWPFTGGCHYALDCEKYHDRCGSCPQLGSRKEYDLSRWIWKRKQSAWKNLNLTIVATSNWMAECARNSSLFSENRIEVIPIGLDSERFKLVDKVTCRNLWGLPQEKKIILFGGGTQTSYKGLDLLVDTLKNLSKNGFMRDKELVIFGSPILSNPPDYGFSTRYLGVLSDDVSLVSLYSSADVTVVPSIQESFGQVASESLACGTPVVAFDAQGPKDIVDHKTNGYLSRPYEIDDLANGIAWVLSDSGRWQELSRCAREKVEREFTVELQARRYLKLYEDILSQNRLNNE